MAKKKATRSTKKSKAKFTVSQGSFKDNVMVVIDTAETLARKKKAEEDEDVRYFPWFQMGTRKFRKVIEALDDPATRRAIEEILG